MLPPNLPDHLRVFTALVPTAEARAAMDMARRRWLDARHGVRPEAEHLHLTLQFFPKLPRVQVQAWLHGLAALQFEPFEVVLNRAEHWGRGDRTLLVLRSDPSEPLSALHAMTNDIARQAGLTLESRRWKPHVTVLRDAASIELAPLLQPVAWCVQDVVLIWSELQARPARYHVLGRFGGRGTVPR